MHPSHDEPHKYGIPLQRIQVTTPVNAMKKRVNIQSSMSDILFPVEMRENENRTNSEYSRIVVGKIDGEEWHLNYCSDVYQLVPNKDIFPKVEEVLNANGIKFESRYSHTNHEFGESADYYVIHSCTVTGHRTSSCCGSAAIGRNLDRSEVRNHNTRSAGHFAE